MLLYLCRESVDGELDSEKFAEVEKKWQQIHNKLQQRLIFQMCQHKTHVLGKYVHKCALVAAERSFM